MHVATCVVPSISMDLLGHCADENKGYLDCGVLNPPATHCGSHINESRPFTKDHGDSVQGLVQRSVLSNTIASDAWLQRFDHDALS